MSSLHSLYDDRIYWKEALSLKKAGYNIIHVGVGDKNSDLVSEHGIRLIQVKRTRIAGNLFINFALKRVSRNNEYRRLIEIAAMLKADAYHLHDLQLNRIASKIKSLPHQPKVVYDVHEPYPVTLADGEYRGYFFRFLMKVYARHIHSWELRKSTSHDLIIATEENVARKFRRHFPQKAIEIIYNYSNWSEKDLPHKPAKKYDFIYAGGIRRRRGAMEMLRALAALKEENFRVKLLLVGVICDAGLEDEMNHFIKQKSLEDRVEIKPPIPYQDVAMLYGASRCGIAIFNNLRVNQTIMPIKILEYIAFGLPAVCSNVGHLGRVTTKYNTGITVHPHLIGEIAAAMKKLLTDSALYENQRNNCRLLYEKEFNWNHMERHLLSVYEALWKN